MATRALGQGITNQETFVTLSTVKRKNCYEAFLTFPRFITILDIPAI